MRVLHFLSSAHALQALQRQRLKVARISDLNDPFELFCPDLRDPVVRRGFRSFREQTSNRFGLLCFSRRWQNLLLWSMYADKHRGAALEVEIADDVAMRIKYRKSRVRWNPRAIMRAGGFSQWHVDVLTTTKSNHWAYEEEVRAMVSLENELPEAGLYFAPVCIKGIVIGALSDISLEQIRDALPAAQSVRVTHARLAFGSFNVVRRKDLPVRTVRSAL